MQKKFEITCLSCGESDVITIQSIGGQHNVIKYNRDMDTNLYSCRFRGDLKWGFECKCGNDNRLCNAEANDFSKLVKGDEMSLKRIAESLLIPDEKQFEMRET